MLRRNRTFFIVLGILVIIGVWYYWTPGKPKPEKPQEQIIRAVPPNKKDNEDEQFVIPTKPRPEAKPKRTISNKKKGVQPKAKKKLLPRREAIREVEELIRQFNELEGKDITAEDVHKFHSAYEASKERWGFSKQEVEQFAMNAVSNWGIVAQWSLKTAVDQYQADLSVQIHA